ncbi:hypothetical protein DM02DRAFT_624716 [Periconia macrospinosa]|uniref:Rhodopsin domain-containing protein n=1 Tax=Periconia macrospinosa TaxID=97972 RepID=A0A2V1E371_9PLEO|nr:hypothetical protein DM02DRAFT_624716 [Periconia macrospinosa]
MPSVGNNISATHRSPAVDITVWSCFIFSGLSVAAKVWAKLNRTVGRSGPSLKSLQWDDYVRSLAFVFAAIYSISVSQEVAAGLGQPFENIESQAMAKYQKTAYVAQVFYVPTIGLTNVAGIMFGIMLQPAGKALQILRVLFACNVLWFLSALFAILFQCSLPRPWVIFSGKCIDQTSLWISLDSIIVFTNISLAAVLCYIVWILQMSRMKFILIALFSLRALLTIPIAFKIIYLSTIRSDSHWRITPSLANEAMISAGILNAHIVLTCLPFMKQLMEYLQPGWSTSANTTGLMKGGFGSYSVMISTMASRSGGRESNSKGLGKSNGSVEMKALRVTQGSDGENMTRVG